MSGIEQIREAGQSVWYDNVERQLLASGEMAAFIEQAVSGGASTQQYSNGQLPPQMPMMPTFLLVPEQAKV